MLKNKTYLIGLLVAILFTSCSEYQKVLNKGTAQEKYVLATKLYETQKYNKAIPLFEKVIPSFRGKPQMERIQYMVGQSHYNTKQYSLAAYYFNRFVKNYPKSSKVEDAAFLSAHSYYLSSPRYSLDQKETTEAINALQNFIYKYPNSNKIPEANKYIKQLNQKLEKKAFQVAWQYYNIGSYISAVTAFDNFLSDHLGTSLKHDAMYYKFLSAYELGINSYYTKKEQRLKNAVKAYDRFVKSYPESNKIKDIASYAEKLNEELKAITTLKTQSDGL